MAESNTEIDADQVVRRAPFSDNPQVGARGQRTQQRILDAALTVFGEQGYHRCSVDRITKLAGCSRVSFYQYFSSKEDLFPHLAGQVARQLSASTEALGTLTADADGWQAVREWVGRHAEIYERYEPVFDAFDAAVAADEAVAEGSMRTTERNLARFRSRLDTTDLPPRQLDPVLLMLTELLTRTQTTARGLRSVAPDGYPADRVADAIADVVHRTLFGLRPQVNVHPPGPPLPTVELGPLLREVAEAGDMPQHLTPAGTRTLEALLSAGRDVFVERGYHRTRVDDVVEAAGVSHGAFYRYFPNKDALARAVAVRAMRGLSVALTEVPDPTADGDAGRSALLRQWLRRYHSAHASEMAVLQVWNDAVQQDRTLLLEAGAAFDWGRRRMAAFLAPRGFGDVEVEAVVLLAHISAFGARSGPSASVDAAAYVIERGLLGR